MALAAVVQPAMARLTLVLVSAPPGDGSPPSGKGPEWGKAAPIGLLIWLLMGLALFLLIKSMNRNLRKVPASFDTDPAAPSGTSGEQEAGADGAPDPAVERDGADDGGDGGDDDPGGPPGDRTADHRAPQHGRA